LLLDARVHDHGNAGCGRMQTKQQHVPRQEHIWAHKGELGSYRVGQPRLGHQGAADLVKERGRDRVELTAVEKNPSARKKAP